MFRNQNTQVSTKFQNALRHSGGTKDIALNTSSQRRTKTQFVGPTVMKSALPIVPKSAISKATIVKGRVVSNTPPTTIITEAVDGKQQLVQNSVTVSKRINQTESLPIHCTGGKAKPKPMDHAVSLLKTRSGIGNTPHHGQRARGLGNYVLSQRRIVRPSSSAIFDYDLSQVEQHNFRHCQSLDPPMKLVPHNELQLLKSGQRTTYLEQRYERTPDDKYNYPQATSWRYGWFHRQTQSKIGDTL